MGWSVFSPLLDDSWKVWGACYKSENPEFFPEPHKGRGGAKKTKEICARCPVQEECLEFAIETNQPHGVWGGLTYSSRMRLRKERRDAAAQEEQTTDPSTASAEASSEVS